MDKTALLTKQPVMMTNFFFLAGSNSGYSLKAVTKTLTHWMKLSILVIPIQIHFTCHIVWILQLCLSGITSHPNDNSAP